VNPYLKLGLKSFAVFIGAVGSTSVISKATGQISLFDWLAVLWPAVVALAAYWGGVADATPAPWSQEQAIATAKETQASKNGK
jgi:hypothetical protein